MNTMFIDVPDGNKISSAFIVNGIGKIEECVFDNKSKKSLKSNIYLGKITRVEHALQAAFVEYGEERAGFLSFSEIHPDYYQIPIFDKEEIKKKMQQEAIENMNSLEKRTHASEQDENENDLPEDDLDSSYYSKLYKKYNIQEVIKRGQTVLVQVFKNERGNKGASLTTYITIPGMYCVLMPNSPRGIGISKKIDSLEAKRRILNIVKRFNIPYGSSLVVRTAGINVLDSDLERDYRYLQKLWNEIRERAVKSTVPSMIYEESSIIEQFIRDNYDPKTFANIIVNGQESFYKIKNFVGKLILEEEVKVKFYEDVIPMLKKYKIDIKINELLCPRVELKSGGYIIINGTEALTSIDVNSGKAINEKNVEQTALKINTEATYEIARQLKLRNIGGLVVIDFIDMEDPKNKKIIENELRKAFLNDKAKVQFARISIFGLVELSRQRMRSSLQEVLSIQCNHCNGNGVIKAPILIIADILDSIIYSINNNKRLNYNVIQVYCTKEILNIITSDYLNDLNKIEKKYSYLIVFEVNHSIHIDDFVIKISDSPENMKTAQECYSSSVRKRNIAISKNRVSNILNSLFKILRK